MKKLSIKQRLEGYEECAKDPHLESLNLLSFLIGIEFAEKHYLKEEPVGNSNTLEQVVSFKEAAKLEKGYAMGGMLSALRIMREYLDAMEQSIEEQIKKLEESDD